MKVFIGSWSVLITISLLALMYLIGYALFSITAINSNAATLIGGIFSFCGGVAGALGAYFIAKMQMTKQLELQYKKEEEKLIKEVKINNYFKLLEIGDNLLQQINKLHTSLTDILIDSLINKENVAIRAEKLGAQLQEIKEQSTKISIYKVFFDDQVLTNFPNLSQSVKIMEKEAFGMLLDYQQWILDVSDEEAHEKLFLLTKETREEVKKVMDKPKDDIYKILSYTNLLLKKSIE